jgi:hypothetical protein
MARPRLLSVCPLAVLSAVCACGGSAARPPVYTAVADDMPAMGPAVPPVYMHLKTNEGDVLQRLSTRDEDWKNVCTAPCDGYVPAYGSYRVSRANGSSTEPFTLPGPPGTSVALKVDDEGRVWTHDSVELQARRRRR